MRFSTAAEINELETARLARAGLKTLKALYNGAGNISITHRANKISIKPWRYRGRSYWEGIRGQEDIILPETATDAELGAAIAAGLEISRKA